MVYRKNILFFLKKKVKLLTSETVVPAMIPDLKGTISNKSRTSPGLAGIIDERKEKKDIKVSSFREPHILK